MVGRLLIGALALTLVSGQALAQDTATGANQDFEKYCRTNFPNDREKLQACLGFEQDMPKVPAPPAPPPQTIAEWASTNLEEKGWGAPAAYAKDSVFYLRNVNLGPAYPRAWVRYENKEPSNTDGLSGESYEEFDCAQNRVRYLQSQAFNGQNLSSAYPTHTLETAWTFNPPGSINEFLTQRVCETAKLLQPHAPAKRR